MKAVLVSAAIVGATALLVWLLRPGPSGVPATGGVMNRQPRASWLVVGTLAVGGVAAYWVLHRRNQSKRRTRATLTIAFAGILVAAIVIGFVWPGGLLRHDVAPAAEPPPTTTPTTPTTPTTHLPATGATGATGGTGATGSSGASGATGSTGASGGTGAAVTTPTAPVNPPR